MLLRVPVLKLQEHEVVSEFEQLKNLAPYWRLLEDEKAVEDDNAPGTRDNMRRRVLSKRSWCWLMR